MKNVGLAFLFLSFSSWAQVTTSAQCAKSRVTLITDSHALWSMGKTVGTWLMQLPDYQQRMHILGGSSPYWWMHDKWADKYPEGVKTSYAIDYDSCAKPKPKTPTWQTKDMQTIRSKDIEVLLPKPPAPFEHDLIILEQGTNVIGKPSSYREMARDLVLRARAQAPNSTCVWVGPPNMLHIGANKQPEVLMDKVYKAIAEGLMDAEAILKLKNPTVNRPACHLIDSRKYSHYPTWPLDSDGKKPDGVHYTHPPTCTPEELKADPKKCWDYGAEWGRGVIDEVKQVMAKEFTTPGQEPLELPDTPCPK